MNWLRCLSWATEGAPRLAQLIVLGSESDRTVHGVPWPDRATGLALQTGRAIDWALCSRAAVSGAAGWAT